MVNGVGTKTSRRLIERLLSISKFLKCDTDGGIPYRGVLNLEGVIKIEGKSDNDADDNVVVDTMWREMSLCWENRAIA